MLACRSVLNLPISTKLLALIYSSAASMCCAKAMIEAWASARKNCDEGSLQFSNDPQDIGSFKWSSVNDEP